MEFNIVLAIIIFLAKVSEISLSSLKLIFVVKKQRILASIIAFLECLIWAIIISGIIANLKTQPLWIFAYCLGYAIGYYVGMFVEDKLAMGTVSIQFIVPKADEEDVIEELKNNNCGATIIDGRGLKTEVSVIITAIPRKHVSKLTKKIANVSEDSIFVVVSDVSKTIGGSLQK